MKPMSMLADFVMETLDDNDTLQKELKEEYQFTMRQVNSDAQELDTLIKWYREGTITRQVMKEKGSPYADRIGRNGDILGRLFDRAQKFIGKEE